VDHRLIWQALADQVLLPNPILLLLLFLALFLHFNNKVIRVVLATLAVVVILAALAVAVILEEVYQQGISLPPRSGRYGYGQRPSYGGDMCNPVTGIRARSGSIYARMLSNMGVQGGNCGGSAGTGGASQDGPVNPITGIRARPGSIYAMLLNGGGVGGNTQAGGGLMGNNQLVNFVNSAGGLPAVGDTNSDMPATASAGTPGWAIALIVLGSILSVALIAVLLQLALVIRGGL